MIEILSDIKNESGFIPAYTNYEIVFKHSDNEADRAVITCLDQHVLLYPDPYGIFRFAACNFVACLISDFNDEYSYSEHSDPVAGGGRLWHAFDFEVRMYKDADVIDDLNLSYYRFLKSTDQYNSKIEDFIGKILAPIQDLKCYVGYPFEYSTLDQHLIRRYLVQTGASNTQIRPCRAIDACGVYVKWLNQQGAYSYHLFKPQSEMRLSTKSGGVVMDNRSAYRHVQEIGKRGVFTQKIHTRVHVNERDLLISIMLSPEIYLYRGERFSGSNTWERVRVISKEFKFKDKSNNFVSFEATCELSEPLTQKM